MRWRRLAIRVHPTWHLTVFCLSIVAGLAIGGTWYVAMFQSSGWMVCGVLLLGFCLWKQWRWLLLMAAIGGLLVGVSRATLDGAERAVYQTIIGTEVTLSGVVSEDADIGRQGELLLRLGDIRLGEAALPAQVWVSLSNNQPVQRSDRITISGKLTDGFGSFAASMYRAELVKLERPSPGDVALTVRDGFGEKVRTGIGEPAASLGMGYLAGQRRSLPEELDNALRIAGLTHIVVASGYNLTILVRAAKRLLERYSRYLTVFVSSLLIMSFIAVTGLSPSMSRAGLVAGIALMAWYFGRKLHPVTLLAFAAAVTGLIEPSFVWGNLGWQLSFAAFAGVMIVAPLGQAYFFGDKKPCWIRQVLGETIAAQIATLPLLLYSFGYFSNVAVLANLLVLPLVPLAMLLTFITGVVGYVLPSIVHIIGLPAQWLLDYMVTVATRTANVSWAVTETELALWGVGAYFMLLIAACWWMQRATGYRLRDSNIVD